MHRHKFSWDEYFTGSPTTTLGPGQYSSRQSYSSGNVYILNCLFNTITSGSNGGALYFSSVSYLLIESSSFFSCKTNGGNGGAIYFSNSNGQSVLYGLCGCDCLSIYSGSPYYQFAYISVNNGGSAKNYFKYSSISRCVNDISSSHQMVRFDYGYISCTSVNISNNRCQYYSAIICHPYTGSSSVICSFKYSSFADNTDSVYFCIGLNHNAKYEMKCCNIIRNKDLSGSYGIIYAPGNLMIEDSCILENVGTYIFYVWSSYTITLSNCTVDKTTNNKNLVTTNTVTKSFILALNHMSTRNCHAEYDAVGYITVFHPTVRLFCYSWKMCSCQAITSNLFLLHCVFLVTFIHPNPSGYCYYNYKSFQG
jgi:hypothetical protein